MARKATKDGYAYEQIGPDAFIRRQVKEGQEIPDHWQDEEPGENVHIPLDEMNAYEAEVFRERLWNVLAEGKLRKLGRGHVLSCHYTGPMSREHGLAVAKCHEIGLHREFKRDVCPQCFREVKPR